MRLNRINQHCQFGYAFPDIPSEEISERSLVGQNATNWMQNYFCLHCEVMPTTGRLHLSDNYTCDELFQIYKEEMQCRGESYIQYSLGYGK